MKKVLMIVALVYGFAGIPLAVAQTDLLASTVIMREQSQLLYRDLNNMVKGEAPFDAAKADDAFAKLIVTATKLAASFPESAKGKSSPNSRYSASPKVWEMTAEFKAEIDKLTKVLQDNRSKANTLEGLKAVYTPVNNSCNSCHEVFRLRKG